MEYSVESRLHAGMNQPGEQGEVSRYGGRQAHFTASDGLAEAERESRIARRDASGNSGSQVRLQGIVISIIRERENAGKPSPAMGLTL